MSNILQLNSIYDVIKNKEYNINKTFNVKNIHMFLVKFILNNSNSSYLLCLSHNNIKYKFFVTYDIDEQKPKIYSLDEIDYAIFQSIFNKKSRDKVIERIIKNALDIANKKNINITDEDIIIFKNNLNNIDEKLSTSIATDINNNLKSKLNDEIKLFNVNSNKINDQSGGIILGIIETALDALPIPIFGMLFTGVLEIIDFILMGLSALPVVGVPFDIASMIFAILRGQFTLLIPGIIGFIPVVGDGISTVWKFAAKVMRIVGKVSKYAKKFKVNKVISHASDAVEFASATGIIDTSGYEDQINMVSNININETNIKKRPVKRPVKKIVRRRR
jgi:hypothetical protein